MRAKEKMLSESQALHALIDHYIRDKSNFAALEHILSEAQKKYVLLGPIASENFLWSHPMNMLHKAELSHKFSRVKWSVNKFLGSSGVPSPEVRYIENGTFLHPQNQEFLEAMAVSGFFSAVAAAMAGATLYCLGLDHVVLAGAFAAFSVSPANNAVSAFKEMKDKRKEYRFLKEMMHYSPPSKRVYITSVKIEHLIPVLAHEYAHHVQHAKDFHNDVLPLQEGHARGVQRMIAEQYYYEKDNPRYLVGARQLDYSEYKIVYQYVCNKQGRDAAPILLFPRTRQDLTMEKCLMEEGFPPPHALGNAFFAMLELNNGPGLYAASLKNRFKVIETH